MAISTTHYLLVRAMFEQGVLPRGGALLEIGEANWYDLEPLAMIEDIKRFTPDAARRDALVQKLTDIATKQEPNSSFDVAKVFYELYYDPCEIQAIDFSGTSLSQRLDLNGPIKLNRMFDVVINHGTAEHIFNIAQVFRTIHEHTVPGGMMIHESPFTDWIDHGFYNLQPTLFFDLADFNQYQIGGMFIEDLVARTITQIRTRDDVYGLARDKKIPHNAVLFTVMRKAAENRPFAIPQQGYYRKALPESGMAAWTQLR